MTHQVGVEKNCLSALYIHEYKYYTICALSVVGLIRNDKADVSCAWAHHGVVLVGVSRTMFQNVALICGGDAQVLAEVDGPAGANQDQQLSDTAVLACTSPWSHI